MNILRFHEVGSNNLKAIAESTENVMGKNNGNWTSPDGSRELLCSLPFLTSRFPNCESPDSHWSLSNFRALRKA